MAPPNVGQSICPNNRGAVHFPLQPQDILVYVSPLGIGSLLLYIDPCVLYDVYICAYV